MIKAKLIKKDRKFLYKVEETQNIYVNKYGDAYTFQYRQNKLIKLSDKLDTQGYIKNEIRLKDKTYKKTFRHRLIAKVFIPNPNNKPFINHKNSIPRCNNVNNLEWCTQKENIIHAHKFGFKKGPQAKRPVVQMDLQGNEIARFDGIIDAGRGIWQRAYNISKCLRKTNLTAYGYKWKYQGE